jgi:hypothetical protein
MANPINPTTLVGLRCWLTAARGVELVSGKVSAWRDQSSNGKDALQATAAFRPTFVADAGDGRPALSFDGTNDVFDPIVDVIESVGKTFTLIVTHKMTPGATFGASVSIGGGLGEGGGGSYNVSMQADTSGGFSTAQLSTDGGGNTDSLLRQFGTADFETLAVRQDYFWVPQNLFLWSEDFGNAAWQKVAGAVVLTDVADGPLGGHTADVLVTTGASYLQQNSIMPSMSAGRSYDASVWVKADRRLPALLLDTDAKGASVPFHADLKIGSGSFVVAVWYKNTANTAGTHVILQYANAYNTGFLLNNVGGDFGGYVGSGAPQINLGAPFATLNKWYRVVLVGDANAQTLKCYINGVLMQTASGVTWSVTPNEPLYIGRSPDLPVTARGLYRDVVICKDSVPGFVVPLLADVQADFNRTADFTGISARYPLNEASGANVFASVGGAGTGSTVGSPTRTTTQAGLVFTIGDGNDGVPAVTSGMPLTTDWARLDIGQFTNGLNSTNMAMLINLNGVSGDEMQLFGGQLTRSPYPVTYEKTTSVIVGTDTDVGTYPIGIVLRGNADTTDYGTGAVGNENNNSGRGVLIGAQASLSGGLIVPNGGTYWPGYVRDVLLFDRALTDTEFAGVYSFLQRPLDAAPTVSNLAPTPGSAISRSDPVFFDVTDDQASIRRALIAARFADGSYEVVHDGDGFAAGYASLSTREAITNGFRYRVRRAAGWPSGPTIVPFVIDTSGQENV